MRYRTITRKDASVRIEIRPDAGARYHETPAPMQITVYGGYRRAVEVGDEGRLFAGTHPTLFGRRDGDTDWRRVLEVGKLKTGPGQYVVLSAPRRRMLVYVENQPQGAKWDGTKCYLDAAGVEYSVDPDGKLYVQTLAEFDVARRAVAEVGHGPDGHGGTIPGTPVLRLV